MEELNCYICKQPCFVYLAIIWCTNDKCENHTECQSNAHLPHHVVTFADVLK